MKKGVLWSIAIYAGAGIIALASDAYVITNGYMGEGKGSGNNEPRLESSFTDSQPSLPASPFAGKIDADALLNFLQKQRLPVGEATFHPADNAQGLAILIPQDHRYPGSDWSDPRNDSAEVAQGQIYDIIDSFYEQDGIDLVLVEGEMSGSVPQTKIDDVSRKIGLRAQFAAQSGEIEQDLAQSAPNARFADDFKTSADNFLALLDREIILAGAPYKLKAEGAKLAIFGAENKDTYKECVKIVCDYIYETQRLAQLGGDSQAPASGLAQSTSSGVPDTGALLDRIKSRINELKRQLLEKNNGILSLGGSNINTNSSSTLSAMADLPLINPGALSSLKGLLSSLHNPRAILQRNLTALAAWSESQKNDNLLALARETEATLTAVETIENEEAGGNAGTGTATTAYPGGDSTIAAATTSAVSLPTVNPYLSVNDPDKLQDMLNDTNAQIEDKVIKQRNEDAAQIFADTLTAQNAGTAILQFGAGHEDGLVRALNDKGMSVVVIKPNEVLRREKTDPPADSPAMP